MNTPSTAQFACPQCHSGLNAGARFCTSCGLALQFEAAAPMHLSCHTCGGDGSRLAVSKVYCPDCRWLRQMAPDYVMDVNAFMWNLDAQTMAVLQSLGPITDAARHMAGKVGRPWFEAATNGIRLSERQFPEIFSAAIRAAQIMGLQRMPEIYLSGAQLWDAITLGSDEQAFIVVGSVLTYFKGDELLYLLAREMGHIRAGHVMWTTVSRFLTGSTHMDRSIMGRGSGLLDAVKPTKILENARDAALMTWCRHSEITADRAGMLAVGNPEIARKVLMSWSMKSFPLYQRINMDAWMEQEEASDERLIGVSEMMMSTMPYLARRMKMLRDFGSSEHMLAWRDYINRSSPPAEPTAPAAAPAAGRPAGAAPPAPKVEDVLRFQCNKCKTPMKIPRAAMQGRSVVRVICPAPECKTPMNLRAPETGQRLAAAAEMSEVQHLHRCAAHGVWRQEGNQGPLPDADVSLRAGCKAPWLTKSATRS